MNSYRRILDKKQINDRVKHLIDKGFEMYSESSGETDKYIILRRNEDEMEAEIHIEMGTATFKLHRIPKEEWCWCGTTAKDWEYVNDDVDKSYPDAHWICKKCGKYAADADD